MGSWEFQAELLCLLTARGSWASWMVSEASCRKEGGRTASKGRVFEGLCKDLHLLIEVPGANGWVEGQADVG